MGDADAGWTGVTADAAGEFLIQEITSDAVELRATLGDRSSDVVRCDRTARTTPSLVLDGGATLWVTIAGWDAKRHGDHGVLAVSSGSGAPLDARVEGGVATFLGVDPDASYVFTVLGGIGDEVVHLPVVAGSAGQVRALPSRGTVISGRIQAPADARSLQIGVSGVAFTRTGEVASDGSFTIRGVPAGTWIVSASGWICDRRIDASVQASADEWIDVDIRDPR